MSRQTAIREKNGFVYYSVIKNIVADAPTIPINSISWNTSYNALFINAQSTMVDSVVEIPVGDMIIGDRIHIKCEVMNMTGLKSFISVGSSGGTVATLSSMLTNEFEFLTLEVLCTNNTAHTIKIGLKASNTGSFYIRNVIITIDTNNSPPMIPYGMRIYYFQGINGIFSLWHHHTRDTCTWTINNTTKELEILHDIPFNYTYSDELNDGISFVSFNTANNDNWSIMSRTRLETAKGLKIQFYNKDTKTVVDPIQMITTYELYFTVVHICSEI